MFVLAFVVITAVASSPFASAETLLRIATPGALTGALPIYLGGKKGLFSKYGLAVEVIATRNEQMNMQALMSDSVQFLTSSSTGLFYLGKQGLDAVGLASWNNSSPYSLASRVKIKDLKELKGRKIASSGPGGARRRLHSLHALPGRSRSAQRCADHAIIGWILGAPRGSCFG